MRIRFRDPPNDWRPWFAWRPVFVDDGDGSALCWLCRIERRPRSGAPLGLVEPFWEYRMKAGAP